MESSANLKLIISGESKQLRSDLARDEREIKSFGSRVGSTFSGIHNRLNTGLKRMLLNPITGMASGVAIMAATKQITDFEASLVRLKNNGTMTTKQMLELRESILDNAFAAGQSRESILSGVTSVIDKTGNMKFAIDNLKQIAVAATATGASVEDMAALASHLSEKMQIDDISTAFNLINIQGKAGAFTLREMAGLGERLFGAAGFLNMTGIEDLRKFGALIQMARKGATSEVATTAIERTILNIIDKQDLIKKSLNFDVFDKVNNKYKPIDEILKGIIIRSKGDQKTLNDIFGSEGIRAVAELARIYRKTGGFDFYDKLVNADAGKAGDMMKDFVEVSKTAMFTIARLSEKAKDFADAGLSQSINELSKSFDKFMSDPEKMKQFQEVLENIGTISKFAAKGISIAAGDIAGILSIKSVNKERKSLDTLWKSVPKEEQSDLKYRFHIPNRMMVRHLDNYYDPLRNAIASMQSKQENAAPIKVQNNITINQEADGRITGITSDSFDTENRIKVNRGVHRAAQ